MCRLVFPGRSTKPLRPHAHHAIDASRFRRSFRHDPQKFLYALRLGLSTVLAGKLPGPSLALLFPLVAFPIALPALCQPALTLGLGLPRRAALAPDCRRQPFRVLALMRGKRLRATQAPDDVLARLVTACRLPGLARRLCPRQPPRIGR